MQTYSTKNKKESLPIMKPVSRGAQGLSLQEKIFAPLLKNVLDIV